MTQQSTPQDQPAAGETAIPQETGGDHDAHPTGQPAQLETGSAQLVPVAESIRYRRRAQQAEREAGELRRQLDEQRQTTGRLELNLAAAERRNELTRTLAGRGVIDLEAGILLAEQRMQGDAANGVVADVVEQLLKDKPYLVGPVAASPPGAAGSAGQTLATPTQGPKPRAAGNPLQSAAQRASATGRGPELEHYLRLRRRARVGGH